MLRASSWPTLVAGLKAQDRINGFHESKWAAPAKLFSSGHRRCRAIVPAGNGTHTNGLMLLFHFVCGLRGFRGI